MPIRAGPLQGVKSRSSPTRARTACRLRATIYHAAGLDAGDRAAAGAAVGVSAGVHRSRTWPARSRARRSGSRLSRGASHLLFLTQGYAIIDDPTMPIIGPGETANDTYIEQLVASAQAAVDKARRAWASPIAIASSSAATATARS